jgi:hypothetical protein
MKLLCTIGILFILTCNFSRISIGQINDPDKSEEEYDSTIYYSDYSDLLALWIYSMTKWNALDIVKGGSSLKLRPNGPTALGVGFNYKGYGIGIAIGLPKSNSSKEKYGSTTRFDAQINVYGKKLGIDGYVQYYNGYYIQNPEDFMEWDSEILPQLPDMEVLSFGVSAFYIFNSDKFSYRAAYVRTQIQKKSAGSFTAGIFGQTDMVTTDNGFIPPEYMDSAQYGLDLKAFTTIAIGLTAGYLYTWVISKHFFLNVGVIPGFGHQTIMLEDIDGVKSTKNAPAAQLSARAAIGYESRFFYAGISGRTIWRNFEHNGYDLDLATEQLRVFVGKRLDLTKKRK